MARRTVTVGGVVVHVIGTGPGIVLLHANGGDHRDFNAIISALALRRTVYAVDWPGHGDSEEGVPTTACGVADLLPEVLDGLGCGPVVLVGNSVGGFAALRTAIRRPELVSGLVLVNPGGFTPRTPLMLAVCRFMASRRMAPVMMRQLPRLYLRRSNIDVWAVRERAATAARSPARVTAFAAMWRSFTDREHDARRGADGLSVPTLVVWGTWDPILPWIIDGRRARKALPHAKVVTMSCGHQAFVEMPGEFLSVVDGFLADGMPSQV